MIKGFKKYIPGALDPWTWFNNLVGQLDSNARETDSRLKSLEVPLRTGQVTLVAGTYLVIDVNITNKSIILITSQTDGGTPGFIRVTAKTPGDSFTITSSNAADTSTVGYLIYEPRG